MHRLIATRRYDAGMGRIARRSVLAAAVIWSLSVPIAGAQQYEDEVGDLDLAVTVSITVTLSGDGYVGDSVVYVTLISEDGEQVVAAGLRLLLQGLVDVVEGGVAVYLRLSVT